MNDFLLVSQMTVAGQLYTCRPDLIGLVNAWLPDRPRLEAA